MADSDIAITAGTGTKVDTRTVGAGTDEHRQVVVIGDPVSTIGVASVDSSLGLSVAPRRDVVAVSTTITNMTTGTTAYAAGDRVGSLTTPTLGAFQWSGLVRNSGGYGSIIGATASSQQAVIPLALYLFTVAPTVGASDNAPWTVTIGSPAGFTLANAVGVVSFGSTRAGAVGGMIAPATTGVYLPFKCDAASSSTSLYGIVQATGASTAFPFSGSDLIITLYVERY
jgi:hypothetical protein